MSSSLEVVEFLAGAEVISMRVGRMLHAVLLLLVADVSARRVRNHGCARMGGRSHFDMAFSTILCLLFLAPRRLQALIQVHFMGRCLPIPGIMFEPPVGYRASR